MTILRHLLCRGDHPHHQAVDLLPVRLAALALLDQSPDVEVEHRAFPHVQAIGEALKSIGGEFFTYSDSGHDTRMQGFPVLGTSDAAAPALAGDTEKPVD